MDWKQRIFRVGYAVARMVLPGGGWRFRGLAYCPSCGNRTLLALHKNHARTVRKLAASWDNPPAFKRALEEREANVCGICLANLRVRGQARCVLDLLGLPDPRGLVRHMKENSGFALYEAAAQNVFRMSELTELPNYVTSEYFEGAAPGASVDGVRNENLEQLSFADAAFDVVLTSDVLEHVANLDRALAEIRRVLKPAASHVFTVPSDPALEHTVERAYVSDGKIVNIKPPIFHGDTIGTSRIIAFRDFGRDTAELVQRKSGDGHCIAKQCAADDRRTTEVYVYRRDANARDHEAPSQNPT
jgi:SAM-dependent methyltransferase